MKFRKISGVLFAFLFSFTTMFLVGASVFVVEDSGTHLMGEYDVGTNTYKAFEKEDGDNYITFDYNDGGFTTPFRYYTNADSVIPNYEKVPAPRSNNTHSFLGWYKTLDGKGDQPGSSSLVSDNEAINVGTTLYALYGNKKVTQLTSTISSTTYIDYSGAASGTVTDFPYYISPYLSQDIEDTSWMTIAKGAKLSIRYGSKSEYNKNSTGTRATPEYLTDASAYCVLETNIDVAGGILQLNSVLGSVKMQNLAAKITGDYTVLDLNGHTIRVRNGGALNAYGIIINSKTEGGIIVEDGSLSTVFSVYDFKGGTYLCVAYLSGICPFFEYVCPYLCCTTIFTAEAKFAADTSLNASDTKYPTTMNILGPSDDYLFHITSGYLVRTSSPYQEVLAGTKVNPGMTDLWQIIPMSFREGLKFTTYPAEAERLACPPLVKSDRCEVKMNSMKLTVQNNSADMAYTDFPLGSFLDVRFENADLIFQNSVVAMPGSSLYVDENSTVTFSSTTKSSVRLASRLTVMNAFPLSLRYMTSATAVTDLRSAADSYYSNSLKHSSGPAKITILGEIKVGDKTNVSSRDWLTVHSIGGNVTMSDKALASLLDNSSYFSLSNRFFFPFPEQGSGDYSTFNANHFYCEPLTANQETYYQNGPCGEVKRFDDYSPEVMCGRIGGRIYGFIPDSNQFMQIFEGGGGGLATLTLMGQVGSGPNATRLANKYAQAAGEFQMVNSIQSIGSARYFLDASDTPYILASGMTIPCRSTPTMDPDTGYITVKVVLASHFMDEKVCSYTSSAFSSTDKRKTGTSAYFDPLYKEWRFANDISIS